MAIFLAGYPTCCKCMVLFRNLPLKRGHATLGWGIHQSHRVFSGGQHLSNGVHYQLGPWRRRFGFPLILGHVFLSQKIGDFCVVVGNFFRCLEKSVVWILWPVFGSTFFSSRFLIPLVFSKKVGVSFPIKKGPITAMSSVEKSPVVERNVPRRKWWNFYMWQWSEPETFAGSLSSSSAARKKKRTRIEIGWRWER